MKKCKTCGVEKEETEFFKKRERYLEGSCKACRRERVKYLISLDPGSHAEKERLRSEKRRKTKEFQEWRKGHQSRNRKKISQIALDYYHANGVLEKQKDWKKRNRQRVNEYSAEEKKRRPFKHAARAYVAAAIKESILIRPNQCSNCLKECKPEAHHEDYLKPIEVVWLCRSCHGRVHRKHRNDNGSSTSKYDL